MDVLFITTFVIGTANGPSSFTVATITQVAELPANGTSTVTGVTGGTPTYSFHLMVELFQQLLMRQVYPTWARIALQIKDANSCTITALMLWRVMHPTAAVTSSLNIFM